MQTTTVLFCELVMKKSKRGRPKTVGNSGQVVKVSFALTTQQLNKLKARAKREGVTVSELLRQVAA